MNKVNNFKNPAYISDYFIVTDNLISLGLSTFENFHDGASLMVDVLCGKVKGCLTLCADTHWPFLCTLHENVESNPAFIRVCTFINKLQGFYITIQYELLNRKVAALLVTLHMDSGLQSEGEERPTFDTSSYVKQKDCPKEEVKSFLK